jgi:hypothetical protein
LGLSQSTQVDDADCASLGIDQPSSITDCPSYLQPLKEPAVIMQEAREKTSHFMAGYLVFSICEKLWFIYQNWVIGFWESWFMNLKNRPDNHRRSVPCF